MVVVIPAYEPDYRLENLISSLKKEKNLKLIVVNDGSSSDDVFNKIKDESVIFADADGQHSSDDIIKLSLLDDNFSLIIGTRDFNLKHVPFSSKFGNRITSLIVYNKTKKYIKDTQSGLRLIPYKYIKDIINLEGSRYEYEINILLYFLKNDISIKEIPITTIYETKKNETSHYRCIKDSLRIYKIIKNVKIWLLLKNGNKIIDMVWLYYIINL